MDITRLIFHQANKGLVCEALYTILTVQLTRQFLGVFVLYVGLV
jgi:hypothetical protein